MDFLIRSIICACVCGAEGGGGRVVAGGGGWGRVANSLVVREGDWLSGFS